MATWLVQKRKWFWSRLQLVALAAFLGWVACVGGSLTPLKGLPHAGLADLPPLLEFANGTKVTTLAAFDKRCEEIKELLSKYYYGTVPDDHPALLGAKTIRNISDLSSDRLVEISFATPTETPANVTVEVIVPQECTVDEPCPVFMTQTNHRRWALAAVMRGYAAIVYPGADSNDQTDLFRLAYPNATWGLIRRRAWLASLVIDYIETLPPNINTSAIVVTGHSRNGKQSMILAAWDKRITAVILSSSGVPAMSNYRFSSAYTFSESPSSSWPAPPTNLNCSCVRDTSDPRPADPRCCWWLSSLVDLEGKENSIPIDSHAMLALVAPRFFASESAMYDPCEPTFAVERAYLAGKDVYTYLNATTRIHLVWRQGQHHGFELIDSYMDMFDYALGRGTFTRNDFPEVLLHDFNWSLWNEMHPFVPPPPPASPIKNRILYGLGDIPSRIWSPGGQYGLLSFEYIQEMMRQGNSLYFTDSHSLITRMAINFGPYLHGNLYWDTSKMSLGTNSTNPVVLFIHPYSYQGGYIDDYRHDSRPFFESLAASGFLVVAFDQVGFGRRTVEKRRFYQSASSHNRSLLGRMVFDIQCAIDAISSSQTGFHPDGMPLSDTYNGKLYPLVDINRIYIAGYAMGGVAALYAAALDTRIAGLVSIAAFSPLRNATLEPWTGAHRRLYEWHALQPRLGWFSSSPHEFPYDYDDVLREILPRPILVVVPKHDRTCDVPSLLQLLKGVSNRSLTVVTTDDVNVLNDNIVNIATSWLHKISSKIR